MTTVAVEPGAEPLSPRGVMTGKDAGVAVGFRDVDATGEGGRYAALEADQGGTFLAVITGVRVVGRVPPAAT